LLDAASASAHKLGVGQAWRFDGSGPAMLAMVLAWAGDQYRRLSEASRVVPAVWS
jgi:hypothetical protein